MTSHFAHGAASVPAKGVGRGCARKLPLAASASGCSCAGPRRRAPSQASATGSGPWRPPWRCGRLSGAGSRMWRGGGVARRGPPVGLAVPGSRPPGLRSAAPRVRPSSPRARHQPELATERPNNGARTNPCCAVIRPLRHPQVLHRKLTPLPPGPPSPIGVRAGRQVSAVRASGPHCRGHTTAKAGLDNREIRPIRQDQQCWYERTARPAGIRPPIRNTSACPGPAPSRPLSPARAYAVVRRTRRRGGAVRGAAVPVGRAPRGVACVCCAR